MRGSAVAGPDHGPEPILEPSQGFRDQQNAVSIVPGVGKVDVSVVWDPPWEPSRMSEEARVVLNML